MIEILFVASQFQCGAETPLAQFEIIVEEMAGLNTPIFHTLQVGESIILERDNYIGATINDIANADCMSVFEFKEATVNTIPNLPGLYNQPDVASYLDELQGAESIYLYEFGSLNGPSADFNDLILRIDWDYKSVELYAD